MSESEKAGRPTPEWTSFSGIPLKSHYGPEDIPEDVPIGEKLLAILLLGCEKPPPPN